VNGFDLTLTFDNGPTDDTPRVLDLLGRYGIAATFFAVGRQLEQPALRAHAERAHAEGHWIGNHTFTHPRSLGSLTDAGDAVTEIERTQRALGSLAHPNRLFRPSANSGQLDHRVLNAPVLDHLQAGRFTMVLWNALAHDWERPDWMDVALSEVAVRPWSLLVLHDQPNRAMPALARFVPEVLARGGRFRQDHPPACVPIRNGVIISPVDYLLRPS